MTEASRVQTLLIAQDAEINNLKNRIEKLEAVLEAVIRYAGNAGDDYLADQARKALEGKDD